MEARIIGLLVVLGILIIIHFSTGGFSNFFGLNIKWWHILLFLGFIFLLYFNIIDQIFRFLMKGEFGIAYLIAFLILVGYIIYKLFNNGN